MNLREQHVSPFLNPLILQANPPELLNYLAVKQLMLVITDQTERKLIFKEIPKRIISIVPSQTELLYDLGLDQEIIGITKFCVHPNSWFRSKTRIGGTKSLNLALIEELGPDLIIANKEENTQAEVKALMNKFPVYISDISNLDDALQMISDIAAITGKREEGMILTNDILRQFATLPSYQTKLKAIYLIWKQPYMTIGGDSFINSMMLMAGFQNLYSRDKRYPQITEQEIIDHNPDIILLASEPFPFNIDHLQEFSSRMPNTNFLLVDGEMFSWYGSRLVKAPSYFIKLNEQLSGLPDKIA